jgi:hypothetical protein
LNIDFKPFVLVSRGSRGSRGARGRGAGRGAGDAAGSAGGLRRSKRVSGRSATTEEEEVEKEGGKGRGKEVEEVEVEEVLISSQSQRNLSQQPFRNQPSIPSTTQSSPSRTSTHQSSTSHPSLPTQQSSESNIIDIEYRDWTPRSRSDTPGAGVSPSMSRRSTPAFEIPTQRSQPERTPDVTQPEHTPQLPEPEHTPQLPEPETPQLTNFQQIEKLFAKQGKQIRAIYEMQKTAHEKLSSVQAQLKKLTSKNTELSKKVFGVSNHNLV